LKEQVCNIKQNVSTAEAVHENCSGKQESLSPGTTMLKWCPLNGYVNQQLQLGH